jgi:hypothetical protein
LGARDYRKTESARRDDGQLIKTSSENPMGTPRLFVSVPQGVIGINPISGLSRLGMSHQIRGISRFFSE